MDIATISIVFFGSGPVAAKSLKFLSKHFVIEAVITKAVPSHHKGIAPVEALANDLHLPLLFASSKTELDTLMAQNSFQSELGIIIDYGVIVSQDVISRFSHGIVNSHFSLLPQWRGADPITFSILSGQPNTGVSLMLIEPSLDTGKLITQKSLKIKPSDTTPSLTDRLIKLSNELIVEYIPSYLLGNIKPRRQPHPDRATYSRKLTKSDGVIDWHKPTDQIEREVRAYSDWPRSYTTFGKHKIIITKAHIEQTKKTPLHILCGDGAYIAIDELIAPSGKKMDSGSFIRGYATD